LLVLVEGRGRDLNPGARLHRQGGDIDELLAQFYHFNRVDLRLADKTAKDYRRKIRRFLAALKKPVEAVTVEDVREWLRPLADGSANTYGNALKPLKIFFHDFIAHGHDKRGCDCVICWENDLDEEQAKEMPEIISIKDSVEEFM
jgi:site-specific recombinase XerD